VATDFNRIKDAKKNADERKNFNLGAFDHDKQGFLCDLRDPFANFRS